MTRRGTEVALLVALLWSAHSAAAQIELVGLFGKKAVVNIDGTRHVLTVDEPGPQGVKLIAVDGEQAVIEVNGKRATYTMGASASLNSTFSAPVATEVTIGPDMSGMYRTHGSINGTAVKFLVDTGATVIALNGGQARRMGIDFKRDGQPVPMATASGMVTAYLVKLDRVKVGGIELYGVDAAVIDGNALAGEALLGMSFLGRLQMVRDGRVLRLRKH
jgi:aspartyl protease family protein